MIPIKLTIQGLYSYQQRQIVDFSKLTQASLFGIFGSVGSGKSSILEAITFALYGKTDRLNLSGDNRNYNMMNLKSNELFIEFIFSVGNEAMRYMVLVKGKRNSKRYDDVKTLDRTAFCENNGSWVPIEVDSLKAIIGLTYENFKRTIIIPQGRFQEFLQLAPRDRTDMMKELFGLEKFELSHKVGALETANNHNLTRIEGQLMQLGAVDKEQIELTEIELKKVVVEIDLLTKQLQQNRASNLEFEKLQALIQKRDELNVEMAKVKSNEHQFAELEAKVKLYEFCFSHFKPLLDNALGRAKIIEQQVSEFSNSKATLVAVSSSLVKLKSKFDEVSNAYQNRELLLQQAEELSKIILLNELWQNIEKLKVRNKNGTDEIAKLQLKIEELKREQLANIDALKLKKAERKDINVLLKAKEWHTVNRQLVKMFDDNEKELKLVAVEIEAIKNEALSLWNDDFLNEVPKTETYEIVIEKLSNSKTIIQSTIKAIDFELEHARVQSKLVAFADELSEGAPCPLCGSTEHPNKFTSNEMVAQTERLTAKRDIEEQKISQLDAIVAKFSGYKIKFDLKNEIVDKLQGQRILFQNKCSEHVRKFDWDEYTDETKLNIALESAGMLEKAIHLLEAEVEKSTIAIDGAIKNLERFKLEIDKITIELQNSETEAKVISSQLKHFNAPDFVAENKLVIFDRKNEFEKKYRQIEKEYNELNANIQQLEKEKASLETLISVAEKRIVEEQVALKEIERTIDTLINTSSFKSIDEVKNLLSENIDSEKERKKIADYNQLKVSIEKQHVELVNSIGIRQYDKLAHDELKLKILEQVELVDLLNQKQGALSTNLEKLKLDFVKMADLAKNKEQLLLRSNDLKTLNNLFRGSGFVNYISTVHLQNLCNAANDRFFKLTQQKMSLELESDNSFRVRDFMNGGKTRSVKTLSGGQTFQAALSLALALSDSIQKMASSNENFFFLDEGFGSLDKQSLSVVFDTLKSLRKENRIVGVISHVEEMQQEIGTFLKVVNSDEKGSLIEYSWEG